MRLPTSWILNFLCLIILFNLACSFQTTFWFQVFGQVPSPLIWILFPVYVIVTRPGFGALFMCYFFTFVASRYSSIHVGNLLIVMSLITFLILLLRSRIFWPGPSYYLLISFASLVSFHSLFLIVSLLLENQHAPLLFWDRLVQILLTLGFCYPCYLVMQKIDNLFSVQDGFIQGISAGDSRDL
jgi:hypothetical protein